MRRATDQWTVRLILLAASLLAAGSLRAEPYLAVYQGMQCSACHSHPAGGGLRNAYGNAFAQTELPATRLGSSEAALWTGEVVDWLAVGGDLRAEYRYIDTPNSASSSAFDISRATVYAELRLIPNRLSVYVDQQVAPGGSLNREAYVRLNGAARKFFLVAGQFFLPYGLRLQDDSAFVRQVTGANFNIPDRGVQVGYESGAWTSQLSVTNGTGGGSETDSGKQVSLVVAFVRPGWRLGGSVNVNDADVGERQMQNLFGGFRTGPVAWLAEINLINDDPPGGASVDSVAGLLEANWIVRRGHNIKLSYDYFDPDDNVSEDDQVRVSLLYEYTPFQFMQARFGARVYDGVPQVAAQNRDEYFVELHGFF